jgi:hypothetical protein
MARKNRDELASWDMAVPEPVLCPMCERVISDNQQDEHHLVPKSKGGKKTVCLHRICHDQIHAIFTDAQLAKKFSTIGAEGANRNGQTAGLRQWRSWPERLKDIFRQIGNTFSDLVCCGFRRKPFQIGTKCGAVIPRS